MSAEKVIGVGLNKTGTTSLKWALIDLGFSPNRHISCDREAFDLWRSGDIEGVLAKMDGADTFEDWPWPLLFREADERFPDARFVLTTRSDPDVWLRSLASHAQRKAPTPYRRAIYGYDQPLDNPDAVKGVYVAHNDAVRAHFSGRPDKLLEVCWEQGHGWSELCGFLGVAVPDLPFPHRNRAPSRLRLRLRRILG